ncbi:unnamed protein product [Zymoseptoria tritici ST99CH_3D1]|nr:unnamed protein product [Zymoseptoria tritici ST99CH_3D1]
MPPKSYATASPVLTVRAQKILRSLLLFLVICLLLVTHWSFQSRPAESSPAIHVQHVRTGRGGKWYIPRSWAHDASSTPSCDAATDIVDAAECALRLALVNEAFLDNTQIPLITHQTARSADPATWSSLVRRCVERWLAAAMIPHDAGAEMAWFMWDDAGLDAMMQKYESHFYPAFSSLPYPVEKADAFRILVLKWFGGVARDPEAWTDERGHKHAQRQTPQSPFIPPHDAPSSYASIASALHTSNSTVNAIFGIEADNPAEPDDAYWRMGYTYPVQLTNWALAMTPHHAVADRFLVALTSRIRDDEDDLPRIDPLDITGPPALTRVVKEYAEKNEADFEWQSLSSRSGHPGGRAKIVAGDILILPITGFSPGRGRIGNMGSQSTGHPAARLQHMAAGSWRKADLQVEYGKFCRTVFGLCREWSKFPDP